MSQPTGGEAVPAGAMPSFQPEAIDPFQARVDQCARAAGRTLTPLEVQLAGWFYEAGGFDERQAALAAAAAAPMATTEAAPAADSAQTQAGQGGAEQDSTTPERLDDKLQRCPIVLEVTESAVGRDGEEGEVRFSLAYANDAGEVWGGEEPVAVPGEVVGPLEAVTERRGLKTVARPRGVVAFTLIPPEHAAAYTAGLPADLYTPGQAVYLAEYSTCVVFGDGPAASRITACTDMVLPQDLAVKFSQALDVDPRAARKTTNRFINEQLGQLSVPERPADVIRTHEEVEAERLSRELTDAAARVDFINGVIDGQPTPELVKVMNNREIDPNGEPCGDNYGYRVIPMPPVEQPAPAAASRPAPRRNLLSDLPGLPRRRQS